jgi:hypothetical protein
MIYQRRQGRFHTPIDDFPLILCIMLDQSVLFIPVHSSFWQTTSFYSRRRSIIA